MEIGTKTLLFGCHQFVIHPLSVYIAWVMLYHTFPSFGEVVAIIIHDWGYLGKKDLDGSEGERHPIWAHDFFHRISSLYVKVPTRYYSNEQYMYYEYLSNLCLYHSRFYAKKFEQEPSKLCWADKLGSVIVGRYVWSLLATLTGEAKEYMTDNKYEIYYTGVASEGKLKWFDEYCKFIKPVIEENVAKYHYK